MGTSNDLAERMQSDGTDSAECDLQAEDAPRQPSSVITMGERLGGNSRRVSSVTTPLPVVESRGE